MIGKKVQKAINTQINKEFYSAYLYLAMSADADLKGFKGAGKWFRAQYQEEVDHALKFMDYLMSQRAAVELDAVPKPPASFASLPDMFQKTLEHEQFVTKSINGLMRLAQRDSDFATQSFLQWFVKEQVEEEKSAGDVLARLQKGGKHGGQLLMMDRHLGERGKAN